MKLIVKGDDLGWTEGINCGFEKAARDGILTAAGAMPNMPAFEHGIALMKQHPHVSIGQHTNIRSGKPVSDPKDIPHILDENGEFFSNAYVRSLDQSKGDPLPYYDEYFHEIEAQVLKFIDVVGRKPAYIEGHGVDTDASKRAWNDVAKKYDIIHINMYDEVNPFGMYCAKLGNYANEVFKQSNKYEQYYCDAEEFILSNEHGVLGHDLAQMFFHPGYVDADILDWSSFQGVRVRDVQALCSPKVKQWIKDNHIELINYDDLRKIGGNDAI